MSNSHEAFGNITTSPGQANSSLKQGRFNHETVAFEVEGFSHRVCRYGFEKWSQSGFPDMFASTSPEGPNEHAESGGDGEGTDKPIKLSGCTNAEFESLIEVMYPLQLSGPPTLSKEQWVGVLKLSRLWDMPEVATVAIERLSAMDLKAVEKINLGKSHGVPAWLKEGYTILVDDLSKASLKEMTVLGWETAFRILWARDEISRLREATPNAGGYWVSSDSLLCGYCYRNWSYQHKVPNAQTRCPNCNYVYTSSGHGVAIIDASTALRSTAPLLDDKPKIVADKVSEVFEEELKEAEMRSAKCTVAKPEPPV
ncbi:hypothetical protein DFP72DRAFT_1174880 [Ephemerocybe angulata]|uniref:BTB domain-containing protein n=1 Tax=Ephemerocybe angulata TaxID=980116 RepID=A0A8H6HJM2_9AGAR|nr:hypothetical protein DFP72DRAFT_1174880 [Tulosesus angulatus]